MKLSTIKWTFCICIAIFLSSRSLGTVAHSTVFSEHSRNGSCDAILTSQQVDQFRQSLLVAADNSVLKIKSEYRVLGKLGQDGWGIVFLVKDRNGKFLVAKKLRLGEIADHHAGSFWREVVQTEFYLQAGEPVSQIVEVLGNSAETVTLIKEYHHGITGKELWSNPDILSNNHLAVLSLRESLAVQINRLHEIFRSGNDRVPDFRTWYDANFEKLIKKYPKLWELPPAERGACRFFFADFLQDFDIRGSDMLFEFSSNRWILLDP